MILLAQGQIPGLGTTGWVWRWQRQNYYHNWNKTENGPNLYQVAGAIWGFCRRKSSTLSHAWGWICWFNAKIQQNCPQSRGASRRKEIDVLPRRIVGVILFYSIMSFMTLSNQTKLAFVSRQVDFSSSSRCQILLNLVSSDKFLNLFILFNFLKKNYFQNGLRSVYCHPCCPLDISKLSEVILGTGSRSHSWANFEAHLRSRRALHWKIRAWKFWRRIKVSRVGEKQCQWHVSRAKVGLWFWCFAKSNKTKSQKSRLIFIQKSKILNKSLLIFVNIFLL